jgi:hypothetical protein
MIANILIVLLTLSHFAVFFWIMNRFDLSRSVYLSVCLLIGSWFSLAFFISTHGILENQSQFSSQDFLGFVGVGMAIFTIPFGFFFYYNKSQIMQTGFLSISPSSLALLQFYRVFGGLVFFDAYKNQTLPAELALVTGSFDIFIGLTSVMFLLLKSTNTLFLIWNVLGLLDFLIAISVVSLAFPFPIIGKAISLSFEPTGMFLYPFLLISLFGVPFSTLLHLIGIKKALDQKT